MYVKNNNSAGADVNPNANVDLNDLNTAKSLAATYITVLKSQSVMEQVGERLQEKYTVEELSGYFIVRNKKNQPQFTEQQFYHVLRRRDRGHQNHGEHIEPRCFR